MPNLYLCDTFNHVATTALDSGGYATDSGHGPYTLYPSTTQSIVCDGSRHAYVNATGAFGFEHADYTPVVGQRLRFTVAATGALTFDQVGGLFYSTPGGGGTLAQAFVGRDSTNSDAWTCFANFQVAGVVTPNQTATFASLADGDVIDIMVTGTGPHVVTFKQNGSTIATLTFSDPTYYITAPGSQGLRLYQDAATPQLFIGATWMGPLTPTFTCTPASTSLTVGGATTTVSSANFNGTPTFTSSNPSVFTVAGNTVTPVAPGTAHVIATDPVFADFTANSADITVSAAPPAPATAYTFTGPGSGAINADSAAFAVTPNGVYTGTITVSFSGGGLGAPQSLSFAGSATPQTITIHPTVAGAVTLTPASSPGLTDSAPLTYNVAAGRSVAVRIPGFASGRTDLYLEVIADADNSVFSPRTLAAVDALIDANGVVMYGATVPLPDGAATLVWDDGAGSGVTSTVPAAGADPFAGGPTVVRVGGFAAGLSSLFLEILANDDNAVLVARASQAVTQVSSSDDTVIYGATLTLPAEDCTLVWDDGTGSGVYAVEEFTGSDPGGGVGGGGGVVVGAIGGGAVTGGATPICQFTQVLGGFVVGQQFVLRFPGHSALRALFKASGVDPDEINLLHARTYSFVASTPQTLDLSALPDVFGAAGACPFARIRFLAVRINSTADAAFLKLGGAGTDEWDGLIGGGGTLKLFPSSVTNDGFFMIVAPAATGIPVTPTSKLLKLLPSAHAFTTDLIIAGCDA